MAVTPQLIKELRERSGAGMLDCKKALKLNKDIKVYPGHSDATTIEDEYYNYMSYY